ncbi:MAG: bifunctional phosphoribosylaminoimidazolecarboxamide formyltransferase/IMP cyclohydrolase [Pseudomonadota bacterium]|nr:bifunctional phosphoribosylaminoimidazolecarboxamide formyltransferase/IMP cyclohydrolase [Pseudomonadota bacterium]
MPNDLIRIKRALISVSDKCRLISVAQALTKFGIEIISTGGTGRHLKNFGIDVTEISKITDFPETLGGRLKTLHPKIHGGILADRNDQDHIQSINRLNIPEIDLVIVDLYPFEKKVKEENSEERIIENIDVGGTTMIRAAAKNFKSVAVVVDIEDYSRLLEQIEKFNGCTSMIFRKGLAEIAFSRTAEYDAVISDWFLSNSETDFPRRRVLSGRLQANLRYGENPHQGGSYYSTGEFGNFFHDFEKIQGKDLSYNNLNDGTAALRIISEFRPCTEKVAAIVKHGVPCGVAVRQSSLEAYNAAYNCDPMSAFGGVIALNSTLDAETASAIEKIFTEVVIAPTITKEAKKILSRKKEVRVLTCGGIPKKVFSENRYQYRDVLGGFLLQEPDIKDLSSDDLKVVSRRIPSEMEKKDMLFAWKLVKHVKSNAIVLAKDSRTVALGGGQVSRLDSANLVKRKVFEKLESSDSDLQEKKGLVASSDAFFPFPDGVLTLAEAGVTAIIQPGGSLRDSEVIETANDLNISMVFTGTRHFTH